MSVEIIESNLAEREPPAEIFLFPQLNFSSGLQVRGNSVKLTQLFFFRVSADLIKFNIDRGSSIFQVSTAALIFTLIFNIGTLYRIKCARNIYICEVVALFVSEPPLSIPPGGIVNQRICPLGRNQKR